MRAAVSRELCAHSVEQDRIRCELERQRLVVRVRGRYQFRHADRIQEARSNAPRKSRSQASEDRQSHPKSIAGCGVGIVWQRIKEEVRKSMARKVILEG